MLKLNPEDEQAVLLAATAVREKLEGAEDNNGDKARRLPATRVVCAVSCVLVLFNTLDLLAGVVYIF
jgi:hypothetical protein